MEAIKTRKIFTKVNATQIKSNNPTALRAWRKRNFRFRLQLDIFESISSLDILTAQTLPLSRRLLLLCRRNFL